MADCRVEASVISSIVGVAIAQNSGYQPVAFGIATGRPRATPQVALGALADDDFILARPEHPAAHQPDFGLIAISADAAHADGRQARHFWHHGEPT